jgi:hypothetical protein
MKHPSRYESRNDLLFGVVVVAMFVVTALGAGLGYFGHADHESGLLAAGARKAAVVSNEVPQNPGASVGVKS